MSVDKCVDAEGDQNILRRIGGKVGDYGKFTLESIISTSIQSFGINREFRFGDEPEEEKLNFIKEVIHNSVIWGVVSIAVGTAIVYYPFGIPFFSSNVLLRGYRFLRKALKKEKDEKTKERGMMTGVGGYFKGIPDGFKRYCKGLPRKLARYVCTYVILGSLAFGHFMVHKGVKQEYDGTKQDVKVRKFVLERENEEYLFYLVGETHVYNYSSSYYAKHLVQEIKPDKLLSEGMSPAETSKLKGWKKGVEFGLIIPHGIFVLALNRVYASVSGYCQKEGIPIVYLEKVDESGRQGVSDSGYMVLGLLEVASVLNAPIVYWGLVPFRYFKYPDYFSIIWSLGLVDKRNELMVKSSVSEMDNPGFTYFISVGKAHVRGMIPEFSKYGELKEVPFEFNPN